jgi:hypothetical protein
MLDPKLLPFISNDPDDAATAQVEKLLAACWIKAFVDHRCFKLLKNCYKQIASHSCVNDAHLQSS